MHGTGTDGDAMSSRSVGGCVGGCVQVVCGGCVGGVGVWGVCVCVEATAVAAEAAAESTAVAAETKGATEAATEAAGMPVYMCSTCVHQLRKTH